MDAVNEIIFLVCQVIPSHSAKSHDFFDAYGVIYSVNVFPSLFILPYNTFIYLFFYIYPTQMCTQVFLYTFLEFMRIMAFLSSIFYAIFQNAHTNR